MNRIVVTGLHGYISNAIKQRFEKENIDVVLLDMKSEDWKSVSFSGVDTVIHAAGLVHQKESDHSLNEYRRVNTEMTLALAEKAKSEGVKQFVFISTMSVYGVKASCFHSVLIDKSTPVNPVTYYGISKYEAEQGLAKLRDSSFTVSIVRPPFVYGPNCKGNYVQLRNLTLKFGMVPRFENRKSIIFIDNLTEFVYGMVKNRCNGTFMPQNERTVSTYELALLIARYNNRPTVSPKWMSSAVRVGSPFVRKLRTAFGSEYYSIELSSECGFRYCVVSFEDSVRLTEEGWIKDRL